MRHGPDRALSADHGSGLRWRQGAEHEQKDQRIVDDATLVTRQEVRQVRKVFHAPDYNGAGPVTGDEGRPVQLKWKLCLIFHSDF